MTDERKQAEEYLKKKNPTMVRFLLDPNEAAGMYEIVILFAAEYAALKVAEMPTEADKAIRAFFLWMVREAKIEVIDAEHAIEVHGFMEDGDMLIPVIGIDELIQLFRNRMSKPNTGGGEEMRTYILAHIISKGMYWGFYWTWRGGEK